MDAVSTARGSASVDPREVEHYRKLAETWWDSSGPFWPLHRLNRLRVPFIRDHACRRFGRDSGQARPLEGLTVVDVGCGGGILAESMARLGAAVTGIDVVDRNVFIAEEHARKAGLDINYELTTAEAVAEDDRVFDIVLNMEVVEHVADLDGFMAACGELVKPGGQMFVATINRTPLAWLFAIFGAEYVLRWLPRGTHRYRLLRKPAEIRALLERAGLEVDATTGVRVNPLSKQLSLTDSTAVNYMLAAGRRNAVAGNGTG
ncbi:MAG: bifunctional 2-polyprenyl-6-hydroxyphenol methylase/3-demethylubiquinol 3-O-methyltransferase UbiG [Gammaproteobacteria bacterium]